MIIQPTIKYLDFDRITNEISGNEAEIVEQIISEHIQNAYWDSLIITLQKLRSKEDWWINDYPYRSFETPYGKYRIRICRVKNASTGKTERILPDFAFPFTSLTAAELFWINGEDVHITDLTSKTVGANRRRLLYLQNNLFQIPDDLSSLEVKSQDKEIVNKTFIHPTTPEKINTESKEFIWRKIRVRRIF